MRNISWKFWEMKSYWFWGGILLDDQIEFQMSFNFIINDLADLTFYAPNPLQECPEFHWKRWVSHTRSHKKFPKLKYPTHSRYQCSRRSYWHKMINLAALYLNTVSNTSATFSVSGFLPMLRYFKKSSRAGELKSRSVIGLVLEFRLLQVACEHCFVNREAGRL